MHISYPKIKRLGTEDVEGIENSYVYIQEKVDGANLSCRMVDGSIYVGSRTQIVGDRDRKEGFNGAVQYCNNHQGILDFFNEYPGKRLFGERMVRHTIQYDESAYRKFYLFDILNEDGSWMDLSDVVDIAEQYNILYPKIQYQGRIDMDTILEMCKQYAGKSELGPKGEGVVIKSYSFINKFGNPCNAKYVTDDFKEENSIVFGGNKGEGGEYSVEKDIVWKYVTPGRMLKLINKLMIKYGSLEMKYIPEIMSLTMNDIITEEMRGIIKEFKNPIINFAILHKLVSEKSKFYYVSYLNGDKHLFYSADINETM